MEAIILWGLAEVSSESSRRSFRWKSDASKLVTCLNDIIALPDHCDSRTLQYALYQWIKYFFTFVLFIVFLKEFSAWSAELHCYQLEAPIFQLNDNFVNKAPLDGLRLD